MSARQSGGTPGLITRRNVLTAAVALAVAGPLVAADEAEAWLPKSVAGIAIPRTPLARAAAALSRRAGSAFLFNHCMRTFIFGALHVKFHGLTYEDEPAFVAAALHDLGLLAEYESADLSFEVDSANAAEKLALEHGAAAAESGLIWSAAVMHDLRASIVFRQSPTVLLVAAGAGADVIGPDPAMIPPERTREVLQAFPRLGFKKKFQALLTDHCHRKPTSQSGTWLDSYCRAAVPGAVFPSTAAKIDAAPFAD